MIDTYFDFFSLEKTNTWNAFFQDEFKKKYFQSLFSFVKEEYTNNICFPSPKEIFAAFRACSFDNVKVVIIGQDPYHGLGQANGLCFSVHQGVSFPPSLINIFKEIEQDTGEPIPIDGSLFRWAEQGVLLLNATLTVRKNEAGSHQKQGWEIFTDAIIQHISTQKEQAVFMLWGTYAKSKVKLIDQTKHLVLESGHPSPLSANRGHWFGNKHFSTCNSYLDAREIQPIIW